MGHFGARRFTASAIPSAMTSARAMVPKVTIRMTLGSFLRHSSMARTAFL